jgi:hypothetical protein
VPLCVSPDSLPLIFQSLALTGMAEGAPSGRRFRRASARLEAAAEAALPALLRALSADPLRAILKLLGGAELTCARLACRDFRDHSLQVRVFIGQPPALRWRKARGRRPGSS